MYRNRIDAIGSRARSITINAYDYSELQPYAGFHLLNSQTVTPAVCGFLGQIDKRPLVRFEIFDFGEDLSARRHTARAPRRAIFLAWIETDDERDDPALPVIILESIACLTPSS